MLPSRWREFQQYNAHLHSTAITTAWLRSRRVWVLNLPACSPDLSLIENIWCIIKQKKNGKDDHKLFSGWKPLSGKNGTKFQHPNPRNAQPWCPDNFNFFVKEEEMLHQGKHAPVPTILRPVASIKFEMSSFVHNIFQFNICYVIYVLPWIKYWLMGFQSLLV